LVAREVGQGAAVDLLAIPAVDDTLIPAVLVETGTAKEIEVTEIVIEKEKKTETEIEVAIGIEIEIGNGNGIETEIGQEIVRETGTEGTREKIRTIVQLLRLSQTRPPCKSEIVYVLS